MPESGGTTAQSGIYYQNSLAALYIGQLINPLKADHERLVKVRVEAPEEIDDIVAYHASGKVTYIQAKEKIKLNDRPWKRTWQDFEKQSIRAKGEGINFTLNLTIGNHTETISELSEACDRAKGKENYTEWLESLNLKQKAIIDAIAENLSDKSEQNIFSIIKFVEVNIYPLKEIENNYISIYLPDSNTEKTILFSIIRDMVGGHARIRRSFLCSRLLEELNLEKNIIIKDSVSWGIDVYRRSISDETKVLSVPGTNLSGSIDQLFMWPTLHEAALNDRQDFEFENISYYSDVKHSDFVNLKGFPSDEIPKGVINAGAGLGKTTLLKAIINKLSNHPILIPAYIGLDSLSYHSIPVIDYLNEKLNDEYHVNIDWEYLCDNGRACIFFDGLDELNPEERQKALEKISKFQSRFPNSHFLLAVRDSGLIATSLDVKIFEINRLTDNDIENFTKNYNTAGASIDSEDLLDHARTHPDLSNLLRIPLFLSLVLALYDSSKKLPQSRSELLERYLDIMFFPQKYRPIESNQVLPDYLREAAEFIAFMGLEDESIGISNKEALQLLRKQDYCHSPADYIAEFQKIGLLKNISGKLYFSYPTVQEYLAAQWMIENNEDEIFSRFKEVSHRSWAQTIQFSLEGLKDATGLIEKILDEKDDAFYTSLRLIARCVVNGAVISTPLRERIGNLLASVWPCESSEISTSIGHLLLDGFTNNFPDKAKKYIIDGWALHYGGGKILVRINSGDLTYEVLKNRINEDISFLYHLHEWQEAVNNIAPRALDIYIDRAQSKKTQEDEIDSLRSLIENLPVTSIPNERWLEIYTNNNLHPIIRLVGATRAGTVDPDEEKELFNASVSDWLISGESHHYSYAATKLLWRMKSGLELYYQYISDENTPLDVVEHILFSLLHSEQDDIHINEILSNSYKLLSVSEDIKFKIGILLSARGSDEYKNITLNSLSDQSFENINLWCFHMGHYPKKLAMEGLQIIKSIDLDSNEFQGLLGTLSTGLTYVMEASLDCGGVLDTPYFHPATPFFSDWLFNKYSEYCYQPWEKLKVLDDLSRIYSSVHIEYPEQLILDSLTEMSNNSQNDNSNNIEYAISAGLRLCKREAYSLPEKIFFKIIDTNQYNLILEALRQLTPRATSNTLKQIVSLYNECDDSHYRGLYMSSLESISSRLGSKIIEKEGSLSIEV